MTESFKKMTDKINEFWAGLSKNQRIKIIISFLIILVGIILLVYFMNRPTYALLFGGLTPEDAGRVVETLDTQYKVPYRLENGGTTIYVPRQYRDKLRIELASADILDDGFSIDDAFTGSMATTDMERQKRYNYFLQTEIENSIKTIDGIKDATVVISPPEDTPMVLGMDDRPATAAVKIDMSSGVQLSQEQVNGIIQFVSKSVPGLKPENVSVINNNGEILSYDNGTTTGSANTQMRLRRDVEETFKRNLQSMLERIYGIGNVIVNVSTPMNFDYYKTDKTSYEPNSNEMGDVINEKSAIRSYQQLKQSSTGTQTGGAAGAAANVPPIYPTGDNNTSSSDSTNTTINYELNEIKEEYVKAQGQIDTHLITVSVVVNSNELNNTDITNIRNLVKNAVGLTGDSEQQITVLAQQFAKPMQDTTSETQSTVSPYLIIALISALVIGGLILMRRIFMRRKESEVQPSASSVQQMPIEEITVKEDENDPKKQIERLIKQKPDVVAQLIRTWLNEE